jgi:hypothetical protein
MAGTTLGSDEALLDRLKYHVDMIAGWIFCRDLGKGQYAGLLMWPVLMLGSVLRIETDRLLFTTSLRGAKRKSWGTIRGGQMLEMMWRKVDEQQMPPGPRGLCMMMQTAGLNLCVT